MLHADSSTSPVAPLIVENCDIFGFGTNGINIAPSANTNRIAVTNTTLTNNTAGGLNVAPRAGTTNVFLSGVQANKNGFGFGVAPTGAAVASVIVDHSSASLNTGNGVQASGTGAIQLSNSAFTFNLNGVNITSPASGNTFSNNVIAQNSGSNIVGSLPANTLK